MNATELRADRAKAIAEARAIVEVAKGEGRDASAEERELIDRLMAASAAKLADAVRVEGIEAAERGFGVPVRSGHREPLVTDEAPVRGDEQRVAAYRKYLRSGGNLSALDADERRDLQADADVDGGYIVPPAGILAEIIRNVDNATVIRGLARVIPTGRNGIGVPTVTDRAGDATWGTELQTAPEDTSLKLGKRSLKPKDLSFLIKVSKVLLAESPQADSFVNAEIGYAMGVTEEKAFMIGDGALQPLGLFVGSADGIPTSRDVSTSNTSTAIGADNLVRVKYAVKQAYWGGSVWVFHRDAMLAIALLKDGNGQYLLKPGLKGIDGDELLGHRVILSEYAPNTFTTGLYVGLFGDLSNYWIAESMGAFSLQRLVELFALKNQVAFIARAAVDAMPVRAEAFARVTLA